VLGHHWVGAEGTIVAATSQPMELPGKHGLRQVTVYDVDVRTPAGDTEPVSVPSDEHLWLDPGTVVRLEINSKTGESRLHPRADQVIVSTGGPVPARARAESGLAGSAATDPAAGGVDLAQIFGGNLPAGAQVHVVGGDQAAEILRQVMSASPGDMAAVKENLRHLIAGQEAHGQGEDEA
jgi:hypothetical protein